MLPERLRFVQRFHRKDGAGTGLAYYLNAAEVALANTGHDFEIGRVEVVLHGKGRNTPPLKKDEQFPKIKK